MRLMHLADLHIGKKVNGYSMRKDQQYVLQQVLDVADKEQVDGVVIAGDIYDKSVPAGEAVQLLDWFLTSLNEMQLPVYIVSGNHDSGQRLSFGAAMMKKTGIYMESIYDGKLEPIVLEDEWGPLNLYLLPFVKPIDVRNALGTPDDCDDCETIRTYDDAIAAVLQGTVIDSKVRNVLVAHQFVTGATRCDSEDLSVGGIDHVSASLFDAFDYVALGHIHGPQSMGRAEVRYAGTLLKYSFSEVDHDKSITIIDFGQKGDVAIRTIPVQPLYDMRVIRGDYATLMSPEFYGKQKKDDYLKIILSNKEDIPEAMGRLSSVYPHIMVLEYERLKKEMRAYDGEQMIRDAKRPQEYLAEFYEGLNGEVMTSYQEKILNSACKEIWG